MCFINDENNTLIPNQFNIAGIIATVFLNAAHLLNGSERSAYWPDRHFLVLLPKHLYPHVLYRTRIVGKTTVIHQGLGSQLHTVHQEHHLIGIP